MLLMFKQSELELLCNVVHELSLTPVNTVYQEWEVKVMDAIGRNRRDSVVKKKMNCVG